MFKKILRKVSGQRVSAIEARRNAERRDIRKLDEKALHGICGWFDIDCFVLCARPR